MFTVRAEGSEGVRGVVGKDVLFAFIAVHDYEIFVTGRGDVGHALAVRTEDGPVDVVIYLAFFAVDYHKSIAPVGPGSIGKTFAIGTEDGHADVVVYLAFLPSTATNLLPPLPPSDITI